MFLKQNSLDFTPENVSNKNNGTLTTSTTTYPTSGAVKSVTDSKLDINGNAVTATIAQNSDFIRVLSNSVTNTDFNVPFATTNGTYESLIFKSSFTFNPFTQLLKVPNATFTGSVIVPNAVLLTEAVNKSQLDLKSNTADMSQLLRYETVWNSGSQTFTLPDTYYAVQNVIVQGVSLSNSQYTLTSPTQVTINDVLDAGDYIVIIYGTNASANLAPYYTQGQVDAQLNLKQDVLINPLTGIGAVNYFPLFSGNRSLVNSIAKQSLSRIGFSGSNMFIGDTPETNRDARFYVNTPAVLTNYGGHTFGDYTPITQTSGGSGISAYASFDSKAVMSGTDSFDHFINFQARNVYEGAGTISSMEGVRTSIVHNGTGIATNAIGLSVTNKQGSGPITNLYGLKVASQSGATNNYAIYTDVGEVRFGDKVTLATSPTTSAGTYEVLTRNTISGLVEKKISSDFITQAQVDLKANIASPTLTGTPTAPTATNGTNTTQIATTAFVMANTSNTATSGTYVPVFTNTMNVTSSTLFQATYTKIGNIVTVYIGLAINVTTSGTNTYLNFTLPFTTTDTTQQGTGVVNITTTGAALNAAGVVNITSASGGEAAFYPTGQDSALCAISFQYSIN